VCVVNLVVNNLLVTDPKLDEICSVTAQDSTIVTQKVLLNQDDQRKNHKFLKNLELTGTIMMK